MFDLQHWLAIRFRPTSALSQFLSVRARRPRAAAARALLPPRRGRLDLSRLHAHAGAAAPASATSDVPLVSAITDLVAAALLGLAGRGPAPDHAPRVRGGGAPRSRARRRSPACAGSPRRASPTRAGPRGRAARVRPAGRRAGRRGVGRRLGGGRPRERRRGVARGAPGRSTWWSCAGATTSCARRWTSASAHNPRVHVSGFTEHMNELFAAADVLDPLDRRPDRARGATSAAVA